MERWCHLCVLDARKKGRNGKTVILADSSHCECPNHGLAGMTKGLMKVKEMANHRRRIRGRFAHERD